MKNVFAALCLFFSVISISCSAEIMSFIPNQTVRYKITQEMTTDEMMTDLVEESEEECKNSELFDEIEIVVDVAILSDKEIVDSYPIEIECVVRNVKSSEDNEDEDDEEENDSLIDTPVRFYLDENGQVVLSSEDESEDFFDDNEDILLGVIKPFLKEIFCLVGQDLVSGGSYPINVSRWLGIDDVIYNTSESLESLKDKGTYSAKGNYMIEKMDEETIEGAVEANMSYEMLIGEDDWKVLYDPYNECDDEDEAYPIFPPPTKILSELTLSGDVKWKRDNPLIHACCLQCEVCQTVFHYFKEAAVQEKVFEHKMYYTLKWEAILPSI